MTLPTIFVGHPFRGPFPVADFRASVARACADIAQPVYADDQFQTVHILDKIESLIRSSDLTLFDISGWNPNVTLELGIAWGVEVEVIMSFNPSIYQDDDAPSDLKGIERIEWDSFDALETRLRAVLQQFLAPRVDGEDIGAKYRDALHEVEGATYAAVPEDQPGLTVSELSRTIRVPQTGVQLALGRLLNEGKVEKTGNRKGTRYHRTEIPLDDDTAT